jgi:hypothetical protein
MDGSSSRLTGLNSLPVFGVLGLLLLTFAGAQAKVRIDPEIVRLSYVQGDVRFSRGDRQRPDLTRPWEQAETNLPILAGYSLATGNGRAEIEFEYGSTVYLAENSVLLFHTLTVRDGVPSTQMELAAGTATLSVHPIPKEVFDLITPTERVQAVMPSLSRVDSYLDGLTLTIQIDDGVDVIQTHLGSVTYRGHDASRRADWDEWVAARVKQRQTDTVAALKASGLTAFVPGLTDLYNGGTFFPCAPYGVCWEPKDLPETPQSAGATQPRAPARGSTFSEYYYPLATCPPSQAHVVMARDPVTGKQKEVRRTIEPDPEPWTWAVCHSGAWVHLRERRTRYTFVVGKKRHHAPIHWLRTGAGYAYVPRHPSDMKGRPPLNLKYGVFEAKNGTLGPFEHVDSKPTEKYTALSEAPKEFRDAKYPQLASADRPEIKGRLLASVKPGAASPITYNYKTRNFVQAGSPAAGRTGSPVVVGALGAHGGYSGGSSGGVAGGAANSGRTQGDAGGSRGGASASPAPPASSPARR